MYRLVLDMFMIPHFQFINVCAQFLVPSYLGNFTVAPAYARLVPCCRVR